MASGFMVTIMYLSSKPKQGNEAKVHIVKNIILKTRKAMKCFKYCQKVIRNKKL